MRARIFVSMFSLAWTRWRYNIDIEVITKKLTKTLLMLLPPAQLSIRLSAHPSTYFNFTTFLAIISKDEPFHCMRCINKLSLFALASSAVIPPSSCVCPFHSGFLHRLLYGYRSIEFSRSTTVVCTLWRYGSFTITYRSAGKVDSVVSSISFFF